MARPLASCRRRLKLWAGAMACSWAATVAVIARACARQVSSAGTSSDGQNKWSLRRRCQTWRGYGRAVSLWCLGSGMDSASMDVGNLAQANKQRLTHRARRRAAPTTSSAPAGGGRQGWLLFTRQRTSWFRQAGQNSTITGSQLSQLCPARPATMQPSTPAGLAVAARVGQCRLTNHARWRDLVEVQPHFSPLLPGRGSCRQPSDQGMVVRPVHSRQQNAVTDMLAVVSGNSSTARLSWAEVVVDTARAGLAAQVPRQALAE